MREVNNIKTYYYRAICKNPDKDTNINIQTEEIFKKSIEKNQLIMCNQGNKPIFNEIINNFTNGDNCIIFLQYKSQIVAIGKVISKPNIGTKDNWDNTIEVKKWYFYDKNNKDIGTIGFSNPDFKEGDKNGGQHDTIRSIKEQAAQDKMKEFFKDGWEMILEELKNDKSNIALYINLLKHHKNLILTGAPGTGKTYLAKEEIAVELTGGKKSNIGFIQFHPSYDYTDFVEGLRPNSDANGFERRDGIFKSFCKKALKNKDENFVFIIDEINRCEISRVFGELFFSLEPDYRGQEKGKIKTQYQNLVKNDDVFNDEFFIPENIYIIGTMNDIDRSVESFDFAFRRRFAWQKITADNSFDNMNLSGELVDRTQKLNRYIEEKLGQEYEIGAAYIKKYDNMDDLWNYSLEGLICNYICGKKNLKLNDFKEIFYSDLEK